ncbi:MAG: ABC transporter ATP-binding protein [Solibacillus sp.]
MLQVKELNVTLQNGDKKIPVLHTINFSIEQGQIVGIIGESGSGKSVLCTTILQLYRKQRSMTGELVFQGKSLIGLPEKEMRKLRGKDIGLIMQNPMSMFNPIVTIGAHFVETLRAHLSISKKEAREMAEQQLARFQLQDVTILKKYPHELSGGMLQRVMIAMTASLEPALLLADEPTTALDTTTQLEIIKQLKQLQAEKNMAMLIVSHDLGVIANIASEIIVMHRGIIVEKGPTSHILLHPVHPYTRMLVAARDEHLALDALQDHFTGDICGELVEYDAGHWVRMEVAG